MKYTRARASKTKRAFAKRRKEVGIRSKETEKCHEYEMTFEKSLKTSFSDVYAWLK